MTAMIFWDAIRAMASTPDLWIGLGLWAGIIWAASKIGAPHP